jgi:type I restriction enzyme S subunit
MIEDLKPYPQYKDSGLPWLGEVPSHWEIARGRQLFEIRKRIAGTLGYPVLSITQQGLRVKDVSKGKGQISQDYTKYQLVEPGELAMNAMDLITGGVGIAVHEGVTSPDYRVLAIRNKEQHNSRFYLLLFRMLYANLAFYSCGQGSAQLGRWRLPRKRFNDFFFPTPPASEQAAIARFLAWATNRLDRAIGAKRRIIALLQEQRQAIIHRAVTRGLDPSVPLKDSGIPWLGEIPEHWEVRHVRRVANFVTSGSRGWADYYSDSGLVFIQSGNLGRDMALNFHYIQHVQPPSGAEGERTRVQTDDLLICITGALTGNVAHVDVDLPGPSFVNQHVALVRVSPQLVEPRFLAFTLRSGIGQSQLKTSEYGGTKQGLGLGDVKDVCFPLPPHDEQQKIILHLDARLAVFRTAISRLESEITLLREYRTRLIADVVTGKLDVREMAKELPEEELQDQPDVEAVYDAGDSEEDPESDLIDTAED